jgi:hypothetical protein
VGSSGQGQRDLPSPSHVRCDVFVGERKLLEMLVDFPKPFVRAGIVLMGPRVGGGGKGRGRPKGIKASGRRESLPRVC